MRQPRRDPGGIALLRPEIGFLVEHLAGIDDRDDIDHFSGAQGVVHNVRALTEPEIAGW